MQKSADAFRTISEVADDMSLPQHVLRFWETRFPQIRPLKRAGGRRYYRPADVLLLKTIRQLLYDEGYTIKGVQRLLKEQGAKGLRGGSTTELDWSGQDDLDTEPDEPRASSEIVADSGDTAVRQRQDHGSCGPQGLDLVRDALRSIDESQSILDAVLRPSR